MSQPHEIDFCGKFYRAPDGESFFCGDGGRFCPRCRSLREARHRDENRARAQVRDAADR